MRKTILYIAMSLDGFIADRQDGVDWLDSQAPADDAPSSYPNFIQTVDTVLMGRNTYDQVIQVLSPGHWPYTGLHTFVLTHRPAVRQPGVQFVDEDAPHLLARLRAQAGKDIWVCGSAALAQDCIRADCIDQYRITVIPILLGQGIRLFPSDGPCLPLRLLSAVSAGSMTELTYARR